MTKEQKLLASLYELQEKSNENTKLSIALNQLVKELEMEIQNSQLIPLV
jgi:hypothetical protein